MQSTWLADVPGGKRWDAERVKKTYLKLFLRLRFLSKIKVLGTVSRRQPTLQGSALKRMVTVLIIRQNKQVLECKG